MVEPLRVFRTCLLYRLYAGELLHWVNLLIEILCAEVTEVRERKYRLSLFGFLCRHLYNLFFFYNFNLCLEEPFSPDHLCMFHYHCLHLWR